MENQWRITWLYAPFHLAPKSPMPYTIHRSKDESFDEVQDNLVYLVIQTKDIVNSKLPFVFSDGHLIVAFNQFNTNL